MADTYTIINGNNIKLVDNGDGTFSIGMQEINAGSIISAINDVKAVMQDINNVELHEAETLTWDGVLLTKNSADIDVTGKTAILLNIDNQSDQALTVTFFHKIGENYVKYYGGDGNALSFTVPASTNGVFGPFQGFPKYSGGRIVLTAEAAPTDLGTTTIQVQEV